jgi:flagellar biosynthesis/type III secretory pathway chaperone
MISTTDLQNAFSHILSDEIEQTQRLLKLLHREYELLKSPPSEKLQTLLDEKKKQLEQVEASVIKHNQLLEQHALSADRTGTEQLLTKCKASPQLTDQWHAFSQLLLKCQKQNEINGGAVRLNQHQVGQALDILKGIALGDKTYGPSGETKPNSPTKTLGKA